MSDWMALFSLYHRGFRKLCNIIFLRQCQVGCIWIHDILTSISQVWLMVSTRLLRRWHKIVCSDHLRVFWHYVLFGMPDLKWWKLLESCILSYQFEGIFPSEENSETITPGQIWEFRNSILGQQGGIIWQV